MDISMDMHIHGKPENYRDRQCQVMSSKHKARPHKMHVGLCSFFTCESSYCFQRVLAIAILSVRLSVCPSVRLSVTRVDQSKAVHARITKSSLSAAWRTLVSGTVKLFHKFEGGH